MAKGVNVESTRSAMGRRFLDALVISAFMRYLAVAHSGRGRGEWQESEYPAFWLETVTQTVSARKVQLAKIWKLRDADYTSERISAELKPELEEIARDLLMRLHPKGLIA